MSESTEIIQIKVRLLGISPMIWRRLQISSVTTLGELHGIIQVAMGWGAIHLFQFDVRSVTYGSPELSIASSKALVGDFEFRKNDRLSYIYDMGDHWHHEIRVEAIVPEGAKSIYPICLGGAGNCPPEDCGGVDEYLRQREEADSYDAWRDLDVLSGFAQELIDRHDAGSSLGDIDLSEMQSAVDRVMSREAFLGERFSRQQVNDDFRNGAHMKLMHQQWD